MELPTKESARALKSRRLKVSYRQPQSKSTEPFKPYLEPMGSTQSLSFRQVRIS